MPSLDRPGEALQGRAGGRRRVQGVSAQDGDDAAPRVPADPEGGEPARAALPPEAVPGQQPHREDLGPRQPRPPRVARPQLQQDQEDRRRVFFPLRRGTLLLKYENEWRLVNVALCTIIIGERETTCQPSMLLHIYAD